MIRATSVVTNTFAGSKMIKMIRTPAIKFMAEPATRMTKRFHHFAF
jgi:hypothetical protein